MRGLHRQAMKELFHTLHAAHRGTEGDSDKEFLRQTSFESGIVKKKGEHEDLLRYNKTNKSI